MTYVRNKILKKIPGWVLIVLAFASGAFAGVGFNYIDFDMTGAIPEGTEDSAGRLRYNVAEKTLSLKNADGDTLIVGHGAGLPVPITNGGTGEITRQEAIDALTNVSATTNEYVLTKDTATGSAIFKAGVTTPVSIANGGTGQTTAQAAIDALTQVSSATDEYVLTKDTATGNAIWKVSGAGGGGTPGGSDTEVQYNSSGSFGGDSAFVFDDLTGTVTITGSLVIK